MKVRLVLAFAAVTTAAGCSHLLTPSDYYSKQSAVFGEATDNLANAAKAELDNYRTSTRLREVQVAAFNFMLRIDGGSTPNNILDVQRQKTWLCTIRGAHASRVYDREVVQGVAKVMKSMTAAPSDDYKKLFAALFEDYDASFPKPGKRLNESKKEEAAVTADCEKDYLGYVVTVYPSSGLDAKEGLTDLKTAWDAVWAVVKPLVTEGLSIADRLRRGEAIRRYFSEQKNVEELQAAINELNKLVSQAEITKRHTAMHQYVRSSRELFGPSPLVTNTTAMFANGGNANCAAWRASKVGTSDRSNVAFQGCYAEVIVAWEATLQKSLTAAAQYDAVADLPASRAGDELKKAVDKLAEMAKAEPNEELLKSLYALAVSMRDYAKKVEDATKSEENSKKVKALLDKLRAELRI
jgi:hypothetical protein